MIGEEGPPHDRTFVVAATVGGRLLGSGSGRSKKHAEQEAAREAVERADAPSEPRPDSGDRCA